MSLSLLPEQKENYGVIISNDYESNEDNIDPDIYVKVKYVYDHLIKPFQIDITSAKFKKEKKILHGIKITDFKDYISELFNSSDYPNKYFIDKTNEFEFLIDNENYLKKMFKLLKHINERGIYCYNSIITKDQTCVVELRKVNYKYLHFNTNNENFSDYINLDKDLKSFEKFKAKMLKIKQKCDIKRNAISYMNLSPSNKLSKYYDIISIRNPFNVNTNKTEYELFLDDVTNFKNTDYVLFNSIPTLDFVDFLLHLIVSHNNDLYYINIVSDTITDISNINITKNIKVKFDLINKEIFN